jgi:hypothetical protein
MGLIAALLVNLSLIRLLKFLITLVINKDIPGIYEVMSDNIGDGIPGHFIGVQAALFFGTLFGILKGAAFGAMGGFLQSLVLKRYTSRAYWWVLASALAWACIWGAIWGSAWAWGWRTGTKIMIETIYGLLGATGVGVLEWLFLRKQVSRAHWWILGVIISWVVSRFVVLDLLQLFFPLRVLIVGMANGLVTGGILVWLLPSLKRESDSSSTI